MHPLKLGWTVLLPSAIANLWNRYPLVPTDDWRLRSIPSDAKEQRSRFWAIRDQPLKKFKEDDHSLIVRKVASQKGQLNEFANAILANYWEIDATGDFEYARPSVLECLRNLSETGDKREQILVQIITRLLASRKHIVTLGMESLEQLIENDMITTNGLFLLPNENLASAAIRTDERYLECLDQHLIKMLDEGTLATRFLAN